MLCRQSAVRKAGWVEVHPCYTGPIFHITVSEQEHYLHSSSLAECAAHLIRPNSYQSFSLAIHRNNSDSLWWMQLTNKILCILWWFKIKNSCSMKEIIIIVQWSPQPLATHSPCQTQHDIMLRIIIMLLQYRGSSRALHHQWHRELSSICWWHSAWALSSLFFQL